MAVQAVNTQVIVKSQRALLTEWEQKHIVSNEVSTLTPKQALNKVKTLKNKLTLKGDKLTIGIGTINKFIIAFDIDKTDKAQYKLQWSTLDLSGINKRLNGLKLPEDLKDKYINIYLEEKQVEFTVKELRKAALPSLDGQFNMVEVVDTLGYKWSFGFSNQQELSVDEQNKLTKDERKLYNWSRDHQGQLLWVREPIKFSNKFDLDSLKNEDEI